MVLPAPPEVITLADPKILPVWVSVNATVPVGKVLFVATTPLASTAWTAKAPAAVGVPVMAPVGVSRVRPAGRFPTTVKANGAVPPVTLMAGLLKAEPTWPVLAVGQFTSGAGGEDASRMVQVPPPNVWPQEEEGHEAEASSATSPLAPYEKLKL